MIEKLTKTQEKQVKVYLNKWLKVGYRTKSLDKKKVKKAVKFFYEDILKMDSPKYTIFLDSPMACQLACNLIKDSKLDSQLRSQLDSQLYSQLSSQLDSQLYSQLGSQLDSQLYSQLGSQLSSQLGEKKLEYFYIGWSNFFNSYYGFYDYILNELCPKDKKKFKLFQEFLVHVKEFHQIYVYKDICFISDFPKAINLNNENQLHSFDKPAMEYRDTYSLFYSNGIKMDSKYITTDIKDITKDMILSEQNADQRREIIKKIGMPKTLELLQPKVLDVIKTKFGGEYKLLAIDFGDKTKRPYLQMKCPSTKNNHIIGVKPDIKNATEALRFLNNISNNEVVITEWEA